MSIDPRIRIITLLVFGAAVSMGTPAGVVVGASLLGCGYILFAPASLAQAWRMTVRMRWIFASIVIFYFWFTPGHSLGSEYTAWLPTWEGVMQGSLRVFALVLMIFAVSLLIQATSRDDLLAAILWMARPLRWIGLDPQRFSVRLLLVLDAVPRIQAMMPRLKPGTIPLRERIEEIGIGTQRVFTSVIDDAERQPLISLQVKPMRRLPWFQWAIPVVVVAAFVVARSIDKLG